jgi:hypothetical protein
VVRLSLGIDSIVVALFWDNPWTLSVGGALWDSPPTGWLSNGLNQSIRQTGTVYIAGASLCAAKPVAGGFQILA